MRRLIVQLLVTAGRQKEINRKTQEADVRKVNCFEDVQEYRQLNKKQETGQTEVESDNLTKSG